MTNNLKNMLAQFIAGELVEEEKNNMPTTINQSSIGNNLENYIKSQLNLPKTDTFEIVSILDINSVNVIAGYTTNINTQVKKDGFLIILDKDFKPLKFFKEYSSGTQMSPFYQVESDEKGFIYAIDKSNNKFRFVMLNNPSIKQNEEYIITMRQSYFLPDEYQDTSSIVHEFSMLRKNPLSAEYYLLGQMKGGSYINTSPFYIHLIINVGSTNTWERRIVDNYKEDFKLTDCIITYGFSEEDNLVVICGSLGTLENRRYLQIALIGLDYVSNEYIYNLNYTYKLDAKLISEEEAYIAVTECRGKDVSENTWQRLKIYHKIGEEYTLIYTFSSYSPNPPLGLFKSNDNHVYCIYIEGLADSSDASIFAIVPVFIICYNTFAAAYEYQAITGLNYNDLLFLSVTKVNNIVSGYVQLPLAAIKTSYTRSDEDRYNTIDSLIPDYFNLRNSNGNIVYSKDFLNISRFKNICTCTGNIPNTDLNDEEIRQEHFHSKINLDMEVQNHKFIKNIYENLYLNYIYGYFFKNENTMNSNMIDNSSLLMKATLEHGYNDFYIGRLEVVYEDDTTEDINLISNIENSYIIHFLCKIKPTKNVKLVKMVNMSKSITFLEVPVDLEAGKQYVFSQDIEVV